MTAPPYVSTKQIVIVFNGERWESHRKWILRKGYGHEAPGVQWRPGLDKYRYRGEALTAANANADEVLFCQDEQENKPRPTLTHVVKMGNLFLSAVYSGFDIGDDVYTFTTDIVNALTFPTIEEARQVSNKIGATPFTF